MSAETFSRTLLESTTSMPASEILLTVKKRDGKAAPFKLERIVRAIALAAYGSKHDEAKNPHRDNAELRAALKAVNERLWSIEDDIRTQEKQQSFGAEFIRLARAVYFENDERSRIKKDINLALGSAYVEEKSYEDYGAKG